MAWDFGGGFGNSYDFSSSYTPSYAPTYSAPVYEYSPPSYSAPVSYDFSQTVPGPSGDYGSTDYIVDSNSFYGGNNPYDDPWSAPTYDYSGGDFDGIPDPFAGLQGDSWLDAFNLDYQTNNSFDGNYLSPSELATRTLGTSPSSGWDFGSYDFSSAASYDPFPSNNSFDAFDFGPPTESRAAMLQNEFAFENPQYSAPWQNSPPAGGPMAASRLDDWQDWRTDSMSESAPTEKNSGWKASDFANLALSLAVKGPVGFLAQMAVKAILDGEMPKASSIAGMLTGMAGGGKVASELARVGVEAVNSGKAPTWGEWGGIASTALGAGTAPGRMTGRFLETGATPSASEFLAYVGSELGPGLGVPASISSKAGAYLGKLASTMGDATESTASGGSFLGDFRGFGSSTLADASASVGGGNIYASTPSSNFSSGGLYGPGDITGVTSSGQNYFTGVGDFGGFSSWMFGPPSNESTGGDVRPVSAPSVPQNLFGGGFTLDNGGQGFSSFVPEASSGDSFSSVNGNTGRAGTRVVSGAAGDAGGFGFGDSDMSTLMARVFGGRRPGF